MTDCLFCRMVAKEIEPDVVYETKRVLAFKDLNPQGPVHILIIPKEHIPTINELKETHVQIAGEMMLAAQVVADQLGVAEKGFRLVMNCNKHGGQSVYHLHMHLIGGRQLDWPPG
ncbi:MAG: histidine triad nucleotide-binding protein [Gammaproteobacteria bacterium]|nr:histidine triad nucleotide-binding protein [Gammaproteobacteria bacterium]